MDLVVVGDGSIANCVYINWSMVVVMILFAREDFIEALGNSVGRSTFTYAERFLRSYSKRKKNSFMVVRAFNINSVIILIKLHMEKPKKGSRWASKWREDPEGVISKLEEAQKRAMKQLVKSIEK